MLALAAMAISCNRNGGPERAQKDIFASIESIGTRTYVGGDGTSVFWSRDDSLSIFFKDNSNCLALYTGIGGEKEGQFRLVSSSKRAASADYVYGVYPYNRFVTLNSDGTLGMSFPTVQYYERDSFGDGSNPMVAISDNENLLFRNIGTFVRFKLYGEGVKVALLEIDSNLEEPLSGAGTVGFSREGEPQFSFGRSNTESFVYMDCIANPVPIGSDEAHATEFTLVLPPVVLEKGFTAYVVDENDREFPMQVESSVTLQRNGIVNVSAVKVDFPVASREDIDT